MSAPPEFRPDLYRGTTSFYDRFRLPYPDALFDDLLRRASVSAACRALDLACGPGTVTFGLSDHCAEVWAVDQEPEAVDLAARKAADLGVGNVRWMVGRAEHVDPGEVFDLVTIGTAFHRLDRRRVAELAMQWLRPGGHLALLWSETPINDATPWQAAFVAVVVDWMQRAGTEDRVPANLASSIAEQPHIAVLEAAGFDVVGRYEFTEPHDWSFPELTGLLYSTTLLPRSALGDRAAAFEADLRDQLLAIEPSGVFREDASFAYDLARSPR